MHRFLKAAGFKDINEKKVYDLLWQQVIRPDCLTDTLNIDKDIIICEYRRSLNEHIGICAAVLYMGTRFCELMYYYPYYETEELSSLNSCVAERHTSVETYAGIIDEYSLGISLIFFINNPISLRKTKDFTPETEFKGTYLSSFSNEGLVLLPVMDAQDDIYTDTAALNHDELLEAAIGGDEEAIETLTTSEINMFQELSDRIENEDLYSVVEQSFMPCGVECDQYSIIGVIKEVDEDKNILTDDELWLLGILCNDISFRLCIRKEDLMGEPEKGRRIKCKLWMQGKINIQQQ